MNVLLIRPSSIWKYIYCNNQQLIRVCHFLRRRVQIIILDNATFSLKSIAIISVMRCEIFRKIMIC